MRSESVGRLVVFAGLLCPWNCLGKNTGVGSYSFLMGIFPTGIEPALQADSLLSEAPGKPPNQPYFN